MQLKRGAAPSTVDREIDVDITRDEVIGILGQYIKRKLQITNNLRFDDLSALVIKDDSGDMVVDKITLMGFETLTLQYPEGDGPVKVTPAIQPPVPVTSTPTASNLPPALKDLKDAATEQAKQCK